MLAHTESDLRDLITEPPHNGGPCFYCRRGRACCWTWRGWSLCLGCIERAIGRLAVRRRLVAAREAVSQ